MGTIDPTDAAARSADRALVATETAVAEAYGAEFNFIFVERGGLSSAAAVIGATIGVITELWLFASRWHRNARAEASNPLQAKIEFDPNRREALEILISKQSLARAPQRVGVLEANTRAPSSTGATTFYADEMAAFERHIGELTSELKVLKHEARGNSNTAIS
jgi:hypothetical protein